MDLKSVSGCGKLGKIKQKSTVKDTKMAKRLNVYLDDEHYKWLKEQSKKEMRPVSNYLALLIAKAKKESNKTIQ